MQPQAIQCHVCGQGQLFGAKIHRLSGPAVVIGYILLIPSILGILASLGFLALSWVGAASMATNKLSSAEIEHLKAAGVPQALEAKLESGTPASQSEMSTLTYDQRAAVESANAQLAVAVAGSGCAAACGTGMASIGAVLSFVGGLVGWLLIMKKRVLQCNSCGATVAAS